MSRPSLEPGVLSNRSPGAQVWLANCPAYIGTGPDVSAHRRFEQGTEIRVDERATSPAKASHPTSQRLSGRVDVTRDARSASDSAGPVQPPLAIDFGQKLSGSPFLNDTVGISVVHEVPELIKDSVGLRVFVAPVLEHGQICTGESSRDAFLREAAHYELVCRTVEKNVLEVSLGECHTARQPRPKVPRLSVVIESRRCTGRYARTWFRCSCPGFRVRHPLRRRGDCFRSWARGVSSCWASDFRSRCSRHVEPTHE